MTHGGLSRSRGNTSLAQERAEGRSQGVNVDCSAAVVGLRDAGERQVSIENLDQFLRHREQSGVCRQPGRDRLAMSAGFRLKHGELVGEPIAKVGGEAYRSKVVAIDQRKGVAQILAVKRVFADHLEFS